MAWFKKTEKEMKKPMNISELPELPPSNLSAFDFSKNPVKNDLPPLPSFPSNSTGESISREVVKQAIRNEPDKTDRNDRIRQDFFSPIVKIPPMTTEIGEDEEDEEPLDLAPVSQVPSFELPKTEISRKPSKEPVYVRIDKYQEALGNFQDIKDKILEIDSLLKDIKNIRIKEEAELGGWEREISEAKSKLNQIDSFLFKRLD